MPLIHYETCPSCGSANLKPALKVTDHTVSRQQFEIVECGDCLLRFTQDVPDEASIGVYYRSENYISHTNTSKGLVNRLYHLVRKQTMSDKRRLISSVTRVQKGKILDIGAGTGAFASHMKQHGWDVTGIEPDEVAREQAQSLHGLALHPAADLYSLQADSFDAITLWHVLEHVHDLHRYMEQLKKLVKRGGCIFIAVPNYTSYDASFYQANWAAYDVPRHLYHFSPESVQQLMGRHGLQLQGTRSMWYDSFYISMISEKYRNGGKGNIVRAVLVGLVSDCKAFIDKSRCSSLVYLVGK